MRKLPRPQTPHDFEGARQRFSQDYPPASPERTEGKRWKIFKNSHQALYALIKTVLWQNQQGLCAFCECKLTENNREIEHFKPKSSTTSEKDWTICFENYTLSCKGKRFEKDDDHCGHLKDAMDPEGTILLPYDLPARPLITYETTDQQLRLLPDVEACRQAHIEVGLVQMTMDYLGLNCCSLMRSRWEKWESLSNQMIDILDLFPEEEQAEHLQSLVDENLTPENGLLRDFITTRRLLFSRELPAFIRE